MSQETQKQAEQINENSEFTKPIVDTLKQNTGDNNGGENLLQLIKTEKTEKLTPKKQIEKLLIECAKLEQKSSVLQGLLISGPKYDGNKKKSDFTIVEGRGSGGYIINSDGTLHGVDAINGMYEGIQFDDFITQVKEKLDEKTKKLSQD